MQVEHTSSWISKHAKIRLFERYGIVFQGEFVTDLYRAFTHHQYDFIKQFENGPEEPSFVASMIVCDHTLYPFIDLNRNLIVTFYTKAQAFSDNFPKQTKLDFLKFKKVRWVTTRKFSNGKLSRKDMKQFMPKAMHKPNI